MFGGNPAGAGRDRAGRRGMKFRPITTLRAKMIAKKAMTAPDLSEKIPDLNSRRDLSGPQPTQERVSTMSREQMGGLLDRAADTSFTSGEAGRLTVARMNGGAMPKDARRLDPEHVEYLSDIDQGYADSLVPRIIKNKMPKQKDRLWYNDGEGSEDRKELFASLEKSKGEYAQVLEDEHTTHTLKARHDDDLGRGFKYRNAWPKDDD